MIYSFGLHWRKRRRPVKGASSQFHSSSCSMHCLRGETGLRSTCISSALHGRQGANMGQPSPITWTYSSLVRKGASWRRRLIKRRSKATAVHEQQTQYDYEYDKRPTTTLDSYGHHARAYRNGTHRDTYRTIKWGCRRIPFRLITIIQCISNSKS